jgi:hypothetical protein
METIYLIIIAVLFVGFLFFLIKSFSRKSPSSKEGNLIKESSQLPKKVKVVKIDRDFIYVKDEHGEKKYFVSPVLFFHEGKEMEEGVSCSKSLDGIFS